MKEKPKYNTLQNVGFMLGMARQVDKSVPFLCAGIAAATAGAPLPSCCWPRRCWPGWNPTPRCKAWWG